ncbi:MAG: hypothetical protein R3F18_04950 [Lysobacterales bacterium]
MVVDEVYARRFLTVRRCAGTNPAASLADDADATPLRIVGIAAAVKQEIAG